MRAILDWNAYYTLPRAKELIAEVLNRQCCGPGGCGAPSTAATPRNHARADVPAPSLFVTDDARLTAIGGEFIARALAEDLTPRDMFRITTTSFMDAYNFDLRQLMKSCVHFVLPSGHITPFSAYNVLYREGHVPLPPLNTAAKNNSRSEMPDRLYEISVSIESS